MPFHTWVLFATAYLVTTISPGPNVLLVIRNTVRYGRGGTMSTIAGNLLAQLVVVILVAVGVGAILATLPALFTAMKMIGAAYLMYLGAQQLRLWKLRDKRVQTDRTAPALDRKKIFREALLVSGSNPKTLIFLSAFMPQFVAHDRPLPLQFIIMYLTVACIVAIVHTIYSVSVQSIHERLGMSRWIAAAKQCSGLIFFALGIKLLMSKQA